MKYLIIFLYGALATKLANLIDELENFRKNRIEEKLVVLQYLPSDFFDLESDIRELIGEEEGTGLFDVATSIRKKLISIVDEIVGISDMLMDMELEISTLDEESKDDGVGSECDNWYLGMNLNPADGHIMDYTTGWASSQSIGMNSEALLKDYLNELVWKDPANLLAIVRHQEGVVDAVKVFNFTEHGLSMLQRFQDMNPGRIFASKGGPIQVMIAAEAENLSDDPIFSVGGDLVMNWAYSKNGARIALSGGYLSPADVDDDNTHGLGNHFSCNALTGISQNDLWKHEISNIQYCPRGECSSVMLQGTDHGSGGKFISGPVYGNYALYVSRNAETFPSPGAELDLVVKSC